MTNCYTVKSPISPLYVYYRDPHHKENLENYCKGLETRNKSKPWLPYLVDSSIIDFLIQRSTASAAFIKDMFGDSYVNVMIDRGHG